MCDTTLSVRLDQDGLTLVVRPERVVSDRSYLIVRYPAAARAMSRATAENVRAWLVPASGLQGFHLGRRLRADEELQIAVACPVAFCSNAEGASVTTAAPCSGVNTDVTRQTHACSVPPYPTPGLGYRSILRAMTTGNGRRRMGTRVRRMHLEAA